MRKDLVIFIETLINSKVSPSQTIRRSINDNKRADPALAPINVMRKLVISN